MMGGRGWGWARSDRRQGRYTDRSAQARVDLSQPAYRCVHSENESRGGSKMQGEFTPEKIIREVFRNWRKQTQERYKVVIACKTDRHARCDYFYTCNYLQEPDWTTVYAARASTFRRVCAYLFLFTFLPTDTLNLCALARQYHAAKEN